MGGLNSIINETPDANQDYKDELFTINRRSIVVARQERRKGAAAMTEEPKPANRFMRSTHARELNKGWDQRHGEVGGGMTNYYDQCKVCRSCFLVYTTLDRARTATKSSGAAVAATSIRPSSSGQRDLSKTVPDSYKQIQEVENRREMMKGVVKTRLA